MRAGEDAGDLREAWTFVPIVRQNDWLLRPGAAYCIITLFPQSMRPREAHLDKARRAKGSLCPPGSSRLEIVSSRTKRQLGATRGNS